MSQVFARPEDGQQDSGLSDSEADGEENYLIKANKGSATAIRRVSSNCSHPTVACPTCKGKGKLSQAQSDTMLALIPMHDTRLRPRRTTLKLVLAFCFIVVTGGLCFAFLFPRKVALSINEVEINDYLAKDKNIVINMTVAAFVNNTNFFAVGISNITTEVLFLATIDSTPHEVGLSVWKKTEHFGIREDRQLKLPITTKYLLKDAERIKKICYWQKSYKDQKLHYFPIRISLTAKLQYWSHNEQIEYKKIYYIQCQ